MLFLYNISIGLYRILILLASPFYPKAKQLIQGRNQTLANFSIEDRIIWVHCSSLGEYEQAVPVLKEIKALKVNRKVLLTFSSPSGYINKKDNFIGDFICYLPIDTLSKMREFVAKVKPQKVLLIKYEFWPNMLLALNEKNIPVYSICSVFRKNHFLFKEYGKWNLKIIAKSITHFFVQDQHSKENLKANNISNVSVVGDSRFDRVLDIAQNKKHINLIEEFRGDKKLIVCGSTWPKDVELILDLSKNNPKLKVIIAPHEMSHLNKINVGLRYSKATQENISQHNILIIDSIGLLSSLYQYGDMAYIGGGFNNGIHNTLEAISYGIPVVFGPKYKKFVEAVSLTEQGLAKSVNNKEQLQKAFSDFAEKPLAKDIKSFCQQNSGASHKIMKFIFS